MAKTLEALRHLQSNQRELVAVQKRLRSQERAVAAQQKKIDDLQKQWQDAHDRALHRRSDADKLSLDLSMKEQQVAKLRAALNTAKTNKEYAAILTQINTFKADNARFEEDALKMMQDVDAIKTQADALAQQVDQEKLKLEKIQAESAGEIQRLSTMAKEIQGRRDEAARAVPPEALQEFQRVADRYEGEAMAPIEVHGKKAPYDYVCGGCYMSLNAEHANALRTRDEIRTCDNCGRILYLELEAEGSRR